MQTSDGNLLVCTSPSFNSKCRHQGTACLDWNNMKLSPAQGSQPNSSMDNTEDQEQEKLAMAVKCSEDMARHTGEWTEDPNGEFLGSFFYMSMGVTSESLKIVEAFTVLALVC